MAPAPFFDVFLPALAGEAGKAGAGALQGMLQAPDLSLDRQLKQAHVEEAQARAAFQKSHAEHYGHRQSPQMEMLGLLAQVNPAEYTRLMNDQNFLYSLVTKQNPFQATAGGAMSKLDQSIVPGTQKPTTPNVPFTKGQRAIAVDLFGKDPGLSGVSLSPEEHAAVLKEDELRKTRIMSGSTEARLQQEEKSPRAAYDKDFITTARSLGLDPLNRAKPLTPQQHQMVLDKMAADKAEAQQKAQGKKEPSLAERKFLAEQKVMDQQVSVLEQRFNGNWVGPMNGRLSSLKLSSGIGLEPGQGYFFSTLWSLTNRFIHELSGSAVGAQEAQRMVAELPVPTDPAEVFQQKIQRVRDNLTIIRESMSEGRNPEEAKRFDAFMNSYKSFGALTSDLLEKGAERQEQPTPKKQATITAKPFPTNPAMNEKSRREAYGQVKKQHPEWTDEQIYQVLVEQGF